MTREFPRMKSVQVVVEERKVTLQVTPDTWRTHMFTGLETVPEKLPPSFAEGNTADELDVMELVRKSYKTGRVETRFEAPYRADSSKKGATVLRSVIVTMQYQKQGRSANMARG